MLFLISCFPLAKIACIHALLILLVIHFACGTNNKFMRRLETSLKSSFTAPVNHPYKIVERNPISLPSHFRFGNQIQVSIFHVLFFREMPCKCLASTANSTNVIPRWNCQPKDIYTMEPVTPKEHDEVVHFYLLNSFFIRKRKVL